MKHIALYLHDIYFNRKSGRLVFKANDIEKYFFFRDGNLISVKTNQPEERLGEVLFRLEKISRDAHSRMDDYVEPNTSIGEVLKGRGLISEQDLEEALTYQLRETALNAFPFFDADISFQEKEDMTGDRPVHRISVPFLIEYGIRRLPFQTALKVFLQKKTPAIKKLSMAYLLTEEEKKILERIDGVLSADNLRASLGAPPELFWKTLYLFVCLDLVDLRAAETSTRASGETARPEPKPEAKEESALSQIAHVIEMQEGLASRNHYQVLNVPNNASEDDIKKAYFQLARRFHPDRFERTALEQYRGPIEEVFDAITNAYRTLSNRDLRRSYDAGGAGARGDEPQDAMKTADIKFRQGKTLYGQERYDEAVGLLEEAVRIRKNKGDYFLLLAMAEAKIPSYTKKAEEDFLKAISLEPWNPEGYIGLGFLYKNEGLLTKAGKQFQKALEADPDHKLARQEYEIITKGGRKKGLMGLLSSDLFGSKKK
jgi:curved DNA-binding protein CbpA